MKRSHKDKLAQKIKWTPVMGAWRANFNQHRLYQFGHRGKVYFALTFSGFFFWVIFILFDLIFLIVGLLALLIMYQNGSLLAVMASLLFLSLVSVWMYFTTKEMMTAIQPVFFDLARGVFVKGWSQWFLSLSHSRKGRRSSGYIKEENAPIAFSDIIALQLLSKGFRHKKDKTKNYDINLILRDKSRLHLASYFNEERAQRDSKRLSKSLSVRIVTQ